MQALSQVAADAGRGPAGGRLGDPLAGQRRSALRPQHRALHPVPDPRRADRAPRRRRRRGERRARLRRPQARLDRHAEEPRRAGRTGGRPLSRAGDADRRPRHRASGLPSAAALPFGVNALFGHLLPIPIAPTLAPAELSVALLYGALTALAFALAPARPRPRRAGLGAVPGPGRSRAALAAPPLPGGPRGGRRGPRRRSRSSPPTTARSP